MKRIEKLEQALIAATKLRKAIYDAEANFKSLYVPRAAVADYDAKIEALKNQPTEKAN